MLSVDRIQKLLEVNKDTLEYSDKKIDNLLMRRQVREKLSKERGEMVKWYMEKNEKILGVMENLKNVLDQ
jgi:hypothetical protein